MLGLIHVNKGTSGDALTMLMGSRAFAAVARAVLFAMADPDDETRRLLGQPKNNLGRTDNLPTLQFRIVSMKVADTPEGEVWTGKLEWSGQSERTISEALQVAAETTGDRTATSEAADWLLDFLSSQPDLRAESATIKREGRSAGHSPDALRRARIRLRIRCHSSGFPRKTFWALSLGQSTQSTGGHSGASTASTAPTDIESPSPERATAGHTTQSAQSVQSATYQATAKQLACRCKELSNGRPCAWCDGPDREALR